MTSPSAELAIETGLLLGPIITSRPRLSHVASDGLDSPSVVTSWSKFISNILSYPAQGSTDLQTHKCMETV